MQKQKYMASFDFPFCEVVSKYDFVMKIGHGTYGYVCKLYIYSTL